MLNHEAAVKVANKLTKEQRFTGYSEDQKIKATAAIFAEMHEWAAEKLPMGASAQVTEETIRKGLKAVREKVMRMPAEECEQKYGIPILLILGLIPTLVSWVKMLWAWWNGTEE